MPLFLAGPAQTDYPCCPFSVCEDYHVQPVLKVSHSYVSCFPVPVTAPHEGAVPLKVFYICKVYAMLVQVYLAFVLVPFVVCHIVYALCHYVKRLGLPSGAYSESVLRLACNLQRCKEYGVSVIRAVFFDFYNTLGRFDPPRERIQANACVEFGISVTYEGITRGYAIADAFMARETARQPVWTRSGPARAEFFGEYERLLLEGAGVEVSRELALRVFARVRDTPRGFALYDDVLDALDALKRRGIVLGLITNSQGDVNALCREQGLFPALDFAVGSEEVGAGKPDPAIFLEALRRAGTEPRETMHVGDQYDTDVIGARAIGIHPVLLDRDNMKADVTDCPRILGLGELPSLVECVGQEA